MNLFGKPWLQTCSSEAENEAIEEIEDDREDEDIGDEYEDDDEDEMIENSATEEMITAITCIYRMAQKIPYLVESFR